LSSIVGAIFMILIVGSLASAYFFFTLSQNTIYNDSVRAINQLDVVRMSENVETLDSAYEVNSNNVVTVTSLIKNSGSSSTQLVTLWVYASEISTGWHSYNFKKIDLTLNVGSSSPQSYDVSISGLTTTGNYNFAAWLISSRGNSIALKSGQSNSVTFATVAAGIGSIGMDTKAFRSYVVTNNVLGSASTSYSVSRSPVLAFSVDLINLDQTGKDIFLNDKSCFWVINPPNSNGAIKGYTWTIAGVSGSTIHQLQSGETVTLPYGQFTKIYFYNPTQINQVLSDGSAAVNLLLVGKIATTPQTDYGQNLPFIAVTVVP
jgi:hypothetical protein